MPAYIRPVQAAISPTLTRPCRVDRALAHAQESRRLNVRALGTPPIGPEMRQGLDALEHTSVSLRTLLERAKLKADARKVVLRADDGSREHH